MLRALQRFGQTSTNSASPEFGGFWSIHEAAAGAFTVVSLQQMYPGHAAQVLALAAQCRGGAFFGKYIMWLTTTLILPTSSRAVGDGDAIAPGLLD